MAGAERNTKPQTPNTREIPESKHQKPSSKHQRNPRFQAPNRGPRFELGAWSFSGVWCLGPGASLELGVWNLELVASALSFSTFEMRSPRLFSWRNVTNAINCAHAQSATASDIHCRGRYRAGVDCRHRGLHHRE